MDSTKSQYVYVGSYTGFTPGQLGWVGTKNPGKGITLLSLDEATGKLTSLNHIVEQASPTWLEVDTTGKFLIATHELSHHTGVPEGVGFLTSNKIQSDGTLDKISTENTGGRGNTCVTLDRTGKYALVTRYWEGGISVVPINPDTGALGKMTSCIKHEGSGPHPLRQSSPHPHGIHGDPNNDIVYAMDLGTDFVHQYSLDTEKGSLTHLSNVFMGGGSGPRGINFHPTLRTAYVNCELNGTVVVCNVGEKGLDVVQTLCAYPEDFTGKNHPDNLGKADFWGAEAVLGKDGKHYYYICRVHHSIAIYNIDDTSGLLTPKGRTALAKGSNARNLTLDASGDFILVASQDADCVECFRIDGNDGSLERTDSHAVHCAADVACVPCKYATSIK